MNKVILVMLFVLLLHCLCFSQTQCKSEEELNKDILACKESGLSYETFVGEDGCKFVKCVVLPQPTVAQPGTSNCPSDDQLNKDIASCKAKGAYYDIVLMILVVK